MTAPVVIINKFSGKCRVCGKSVGALQGIAIKDAGCKWQTAHLECEPVLADPILTAREEKRAAFRKEEAEREALKKQRAEYIAALLEKTGLDLSSEVVVSSIQGAWSDDFISYFTFSGEATLEELRALLCTPADSSYGKLRWSNGRSVLRVEGNKVFVSESVRICD